MRIRLGITTKELNIIFSNCMGNSSISESGLINSLNKQFLLINSGKRPTSPLKSNEASFAHSIEEDNIN